MSKPEIFTTAHAVDKETLFRYGEELGRYIAEQLGRKIAEKIYQECQKGERIVSVGEPYSQDIHELNQVETRMNVIMQELVRCKDCKHRPIKPDNYNPITTDGFALEFPDEKCPCQCSDRWYSKYPDDDWFCPNGERRSEWTGLRRE